MGGRGGQPASFGDRIVDAIPLIDAIFRSGTDFEFSNKMAGIDFHWRMPSWRGFELYGEGDADDFDIRRLRSVLLEDSGYLARRVARMSCSSAGDLVFAQNIIRRAFGTTRTPTIRCRRAAFSSAISSGPRAVAGYVTLDGESARAGYFALTAAFESRSGNQYGSATNGANTEGFHFVRTALRPGEKRARAVVTWAPDARGGRIGARIAIGVERVSNFGFVAGNDRTNWLARTAIMVRP